MTELYIVDLRRVIEDFTTAKSISWIFDFYPIRLLLRDIFTIDPYINYSDRMQTNLDIAFEDITDTPNGTEYRNTIDIVIEILITEVDNELSKFIDSKNVFSYYLLEDWVDDTSVLLKLEFTNEA